MTRVALNLLGGQGPEQHRGVGASRLVQFEKPEPANKDVVRAGKPGLCQNGGENAGAGSLAGLHPLAQGAVQNALAVTGRLAVGDAEPGQHLLRRQAQQLACRCGCTEDAHCRRAVPAAVHRTGKRDAAR